VVPPAAAGAVHPDRQLTGVFDLPAKAAGAAGAAESAAGAERGPVPVPEVVVAHVRGFRGKLER
jgi:hypothetical protein